MRFVQALEALTATVICASGLLAQNSTSTLRRPLDSRRLHLIDSFVSTEMARQQIPGLAVGIYSRGRILLAKGYGLANAELNSPAKAETVFQSGSVGKQFVSAAIMMLVEDGKLSLDDSITKYFQDAPESWKPILIQNLLSHTSGLSEYLGGGRGGPKGPFYLRLDFREEELLAKFEALPIDSAPGENWAYRNTNYVLLGILIHKVTGEPYAQFLQERIFRPLGMTVTRLISQDDVILNRAAGYQLYYGTLENQDWVSPTFNSTADGNLYFNVLDLAKWDEALYGTKLLKQSSLDRIWTVYPLNDGKPNPGDYGFGWEIDEQNAHKRIGHDGAWQGFTCNISRYPDDGLTVVVLTNLDSRDSHPGMIAHVIAGVVEPSLLPPKLIAMPDGQPSIAATLTKTLDLLDADGNFASQATPDTAALMTVRLKKYTRERLSKLWPGGTLTLVRRVPSPSRPGQLTSTFRLSKDKDAALILFSVAADGKVSRFALLPNRDYE